MAWSAAACDRPCANGPSSIPARLCQVGGISSCLRRDALRASSAFVGPHSMRVAAAGANLCSPGAVVFSLRHHVARLLASCIGPCSSRVLCATTGTHAPRISCSSLRHVLSRATVACFGLCIAGFGNVFAQFRSSRLSIFSHFDHWPGLLLATL